VMDIKGLFRKLDPMTILLIILILGLSITLLVFIFFIDRSSASEAACLIKGSTEYTVTLL